MGDQDFMAALSRAFEESDPEDGEAEAEAAVEPENDSEEPPAEAAPPADPSDDATEPLLPHRLPQRDEEE